MLIQTIRGILIPFIGTILGVTCVLFMKSSLNCLVQKILTGFAAGVISLFSSISDGIRFVAFFGGATVSIFLISCIPVSIDDKSQSLFVRSFAETH